MPSLGNTKLKVPNHNDDPPQLVLKDVIDDNLIWEGGPCEIKYKITHRFSWKF